MWEAMKECKRALKWMKKISVLMERAGHLWRFYLWFPFFHFMYHISSNPAASQPSDLWPPLHPQHVGGSVAVSDRTRVPFLTCTSERESKAKARCLSGTGQNNRKMLKMQLEASKFWAKVKTQWKPTARCSRQVEPGQVSHTAPHTCMHDGWFCLWWSQFALVNGCPIKYNHVKTTS